MFKNIKNEFPILSIKNKKNMDLIYLDNAATTQKPLDVIKKIEYLYKVKNANIHRGVHFLSYEISQLYENSREIVRNFINASNSEEIIFTHGTTNSINMITHIIENDINENDVILLSEMEHHSNIVPWQMLAKRKKAIIKYIKINKDYELDLNDYEEILKKHNVKVLSLTHLSNTLGVLNPLKEIIKTARNYNENMIVSVDAAQSIAHKKIDVIDLDCDFLSFSGHKIYAETGVGILYGKKDKLIKGNVYETGGGMIEIVDLDSETTFASLPSKYEAGTPNIIGAISLAESINYINRIGFDNIIEYENNLSQYMLNKLKNTENVILYANEKNNHGIISFNVNNIHAHDVGTLLDYRGVAVRVGHHCTMPLMKKLNVSSTIRASIAFYNNQHDIDHLIDSINFTVRKFYV